MRLAALAAAALALCAAVSACGGVSLDPVAKAATKAVAAGSEHVTMSAVVTVAGKPVQMTGAGDFENDPKLGGMHLTVEGSGQHMALDEVISGATIYMRSPLFASHLPAGKSWLSLDLKKASALGQNFNAYAQASPTDTLQALKKAGSVTKVGDETVDGVQTTHYRATIDFSKLPDGATLQQAANIHAEPIDVWIDNDNLLRRMKMAYSSDVAGSAMKASMTMGFSNYGEQVNVQVPDAGETLDMTKLGG